jgi:hypothetical protein
MAYDFDRQLAEGRSGEEFLDRFFSARGHAVRPASADEQRQGIDRVITAPDGRVMKVEYKTDFIAARTGNAFIETISVDARARMGWALTAQCDYLIYYIPARVIYVLPVRSLHWALPGWLRDYPQRQAPNHGYATHGVLVPLAALASYAVQVFDLNGTAPRADGA